MVEGLDHSDSRRPKGRPSDRFDGTERPRDDSGYGTRERTYEDHGEFGPGEDAIETFGSLFSGQDVVERETGVEDERYVTDGGDKVEVAEGVSVYIDGRGYSTDGGRRPAIPTGGTPSYREPKPRQGDDPEGYMAL